VSNFTSEQEEKLKNFTEEEKDLLKDLDSSKIDTFIHITENNGLNSDQRCQVIYGLEDNLSEEQISVYAKPEFNAPQMYEIRTGLCKLSPEQVNMYTDPTYTDDQMSMIKRGFSSYNLSIEQVSMYAKQEFSPIQMDPIISGLRHLSIEQVSVFASPEFSSAQMFMILDGFNDELSLEQVKVIANPKLDDGQMYEIKRGFNNGLSIEQVSTYANPKLNYDQMRDIQNKFKEGLSINDINSYIKSEFGIDTQTNETQILLAPTYDIAKTINAEATVEAEYGDECLEGTMATLAHHGPRANNPAPCNTPDVPVLPPFATIVVSHIDLDTLGGIYALQGRKPEDDRFWEAAEKIDVEGAHHIHELDQDIQDKLNAYYAYNDGQPRQRYTEAIDVTKQIDDAYNVVNAIIDINDPEHDKLIAAGKEWAQTREKEVEDQLVYENKDVRVFDTNGIFCAASYFSPNQNIICPATITYNEKFKSIILAFEDGGKQLNAREIVQELWGPEAGGREGIAGSPRNVEMTKNDLAKLVNELTERQLKLETKIMPHQYEGNQMLSSLSIPDNIEKIGEGAFKNCSNLSEMLVTNELLAKTDIASAFEGTNLDMEGMEKIVDDFMRTHEGRSMELDANNKIEDEPFADIEDKEVDPLELNDKIEDEDTADDFGDL
jgi:hypothetical protein